MKKNKKILIFTIILALLISSVIGYFYFTKKESDSFVTIGGMYDANKNLIKEGLSVVGGVEGVKYITLRVNVLNKDIVPLEFSVKSLSPTEIDTQKPIGSLEILSGQRGVFITGLIDIEPYEGNLQEFCATIYSHKIPALREEQEKSGCISIQINPNPQGSFDIELESSNSDSGVNPGCNESWTCSAFGTCSNGIQTRICSDSNNCGTTLSKPEEQQICSNPTFETNAVSGNYKQSGVWIKVNGIIYNYKGYSSYDCLTENIFYTTPEGNSICSRPGYEVSQRVYMQYGNDGLIFTP